MRAIVLAAGEGKRMRPLTANKPKCMLPVANRPILEHLLLALHEAGVREATIVTGYKEAAVRARIDTGAALGMEIQYAVQRKPLGTGDAVKAALAPRGEGQAGPRGERLRLAGKHGEPVLVVNGDLLLTPDSISRVLNAQGSALAAKHVHDARPYGALRVDGGKLARIDEKSAKPASGLINAGIYKLGPRVLGKLERLGKSQRGEVELTAAINSAVDSGENVNVVELREPWLDLGRPWHLLAANEFLLEGVKGSVKGVVQENVHIEGAAAVGKGTVLRSGTYIQGPVMIGEGCDIGPNCYIRASTVIGNRCRVGNAVEIKNSLLMDGAHVGHLSYVGDSVLGEGVNLGAGTITANLRHDDRNVLARWEGEKIDTGRRKFGCVLGDGVHTGIGTRLNVGIMLPAGAATQPGEVVM